MIKVDYNLLLLKIQNINKQFLSFGTHIITSYYDHLNYK